MTILRQGRRPQVFPFLRGATFATATAFAGVGLLVPAAASPVSHSPTRHPLSTPLHATRVTDTGTHPSASKHGHATGKAKPGAHAAAGAADAPAGTHKGGKAGKRHKGKSDADDPVVPMYTASHSRTGTRHSGPILVHDDYTGRHTRTGRKQFLSAHDTGYAYARPVAAHGSAARSFSVISSAHVATPGPGSPNGATHHWSVPSRTTQPAPAATASAATLPMPSARAQAVPRPEVFAEGTSHPDDDERLPRDRAEMGEDAPVPSAPVVRAFAAPAATNTTSPVSPSPVVQGFGPEIAVPSSGDRPGGTHRRNHPSTWQPESLVTPPEPLEEREAITDAAISPAVLPEIYDRNGRLLMPAPLKGSHEVLVHQNVMATNDGLQRIYDDNDLERLRASGMLVSFPSSESLRVNPDLPYNRRVARPWTVAFATDLGHAFYQRFHQPIQVNSAVRTVRYQARLMMINGNAAAISGDAASPHLTGQAADFAKRGMSQAQLAWMRGYLLPLMQSGKIDVEEEFQQACFHISVYRNYAANRHFAREVAQVHAVQNEAASGNAVDTQ